MPHLAGDKSMKVKLKCPCVRALKGKVVSVLSIVGPGQAEQASAPHSSSLVSSPPIMMVTSWHWHLVPGKWNAKRSGLCRPLPYLGITCALGRETGARLGCPDMTLCTLLSLTRPGPELSWLGCHVTWHGAWQGIEHRQGLVSASSQCWPSLWYSVVHQSFSPAPAGWGPRSSANQSLGSPQTANESSCREYALIWKLELEWVSHGLACWGRTSGSAGCRLQEALLSVAGAGPGAGWRFYMLAGPISQTLTRQRTPRQWTLWPVYLTPS